MKDFPERLARFLIIGAFLVAGVAIGTLLILGGAWVSSKVLPWFSVLKWPNGLVVFVFNLLLAVPKSTRQFASAVMYAGSFFFGAALWMQSLLLTLSLWGLLAAFAGLILLPVVGVVPIAMLATLGNGMWGPFIDLVFLGVMSLGSRMVARRLAESLET